ncbi:MAG: hypothetical protein VYA34_14865 [Myxococcota bacterium]|nr:hypothetical protein [Myxococcota bacterium]
MKKVEEVVTGEKRRGQEEDKIVLAIQRANTCNIYRGSTPPRPPF